MLRRTMALMVLSAGVALAQGGRGSMNVDDNGVILGGHDPVAYHTQGKAVPGTASYTAVHGGAIYHFASAANRDAFKGSPAKYEPAYGGYCAMGVAVDKKLPGDPKAFTVHNGKLYVNVDEKVRGMWAKDIAGNEKKAAKNWTAVAARAAFDKM